MVVKKDNLATITQGETEREDGRKKKKRDLRHKLCHKGKRLKKSFFFPQSPGIAR